MLVKDSDTGTGTYETQNKAFERDFENRAERGFRSGSMLTFGRDDREMKDVESG